MSVSRIHTEQKNLSFNCVYFVVFHKTTVTVTVTMTVTKQKNLSFNLWLRVPAEFLDSCTFCSRRLQHTFWLLDFGISRCWHVYSCTTEYKLCTHTNISRTQWAPANSSIVLLLSFNFVPTWNSAITHEKMTGHGIPFQVQGPSTMRNKTTTHRTHRTHRPWRGFMPFN